MIRRRPKQKMSAAVLDAPVDLCAGESRTAKSHFAFQPQIIGTIEVMHDR